MAELNTKNNAKALPKVDLTAMVDLAFLLITFFMLTTTLSRPVAMDIVKPDEGEEGARFAFPASRTMTILLGKDNQVAWYMGEAGKSHPNIEGIRQVRKSILANKEMVKNTGKVALDGRKTSLIVVIKPTSGANFQNFVDIMDEMKLANITTAPAIDDDHITSEELRFLKENKLL
ncbi:ExbD/TolR family protein [Pedobacter sp. AW31-3R]|uniref:ExbD/TolR family protein n=1 Tax=Pedobacter sp. AW31-3R TaxID=3445781 RepID=UPI003F9FDA33